MSTTLNEKIRNCNINWTVVENYATSDLINEIEILVLNSQVELLTEYRDEFMNRFLTSSAKSLDIKIDNLNNKIKELTK